jgi:putative membrane protein insertion efficiency factor
VKQQQPKQQRASVGEVDPLVRPPGVGARPRWSAALAQLASLPIRAYRLLLSPLLPPACRFYPSCSRYALDALQAHGVIRGGWLALTRLVRCHPFHPGGVDPVPPPRVRSPRALPVASRPARPR